MRVPAVVFGDGREVDEREAQSLAIHEAVGERIHDHVDWQWTNVKRIAAAGAVLVVAGLALVGVGSTLAGGAAIALGVAGGAGGVAYVRSREPDVTVKSVEKGYWTGHMVPDQQGTVLFDATESIEPKGFQLDLLEDPERAQTVERELDSMQEFPVVMTDESNVEEAFVDNLSEVEAAIRDSESREIQAPVLESDDPAVETLSWLTSRAEPGAVEAGGVSMSRREASEQVDAFSEFESMANEDHGESVLLNVSEQSRELANELSGLQETATELLNDHVRTAGDMFGLVSYQLYCPDCMGDDIESSLEPIDEDGTWYCETCRSNFAPDEGVPRHRIRDEVVLDLWDQLWIEKDDQRREVYESIEDQKAELEEREFEQRREEIRTAQERIKDIRSKIRDLQTEAKAKEGIVTEMRKLMNKYDRLNEKKLRQFQQDVENAFEEIDAETERVLEETEGIIEGRIEEAEEEAAERAEAMREEERRRERERIAIEQAFEEDREARKQAAENVRTAAVMKTIQQSHQNTPEPRGN
jgi:hypothetical protein